MAGELDQDFYRTYYEDLAQMSERDLARHWRKSGRKEGRFPNAVAAFNMALGHPALPDDFDLAAYLQFNPDVARLSRWDFEGAVHYVRFGFRERRRYRFEKRAVPHEAQPVDTTRSLAFSAKKKAGNVGKGLARRAWRFLLGETTIDTSEPVDRVFLSAYYEKAIPPELPNEAVGTWIRETVLKQVNKPIIFNETALLRVHGITASSIRFHFDHVYYGLSTFPDVTSLPNRTECLRHFCEVGQFEARPIASGWHFDADFYRAEYGGVFASSAEVSPQDLHLAWLRSGDDSDTWPNLSLLLYARFRMEVPIAMIAQTDRLQKTLPRHKTGRPSEVYEALFQDCRVALPLIDIRDASIADFLIALAQRFIAAGNVDISDAVYEWVLRVMPASIRALRARASLVADCGLPGASANICRGIIDAGRADKATYAVCVDSYEGMGLTKSSAQVADDAVRSFPGNAFFRQRALDCGERLLRETLERSRATAKRNGYAVALEDLREALALATPKLRSMDIGRRIHRVAILGSFDLPQCRFYRVSLKAEHLRAAGHSVHIYDEAMAVSDFIADLPLTDFVIAYRLQAFPRIIEALSASNNLGIATAYDIDDLVFESMYYPPPLDTYAGQITADEHAGLACSVPLFAHAMALCDYAIASTQALAAHMEKHVRRRQAFIAPNALSAIESIGERIRKPISGDRPVTVFYGSATKAHKQDFKTILEPALVQMAQKYRSRLRVVLVGHFDPTRALFDTGADVVVYPTNPDIRAYWDRLRQADIALAVLERSPFNDSKSEIKWLEAAAMGIPCVLSRTATYECVVENERTGFLCTTTSEFAAAFDRLIGEPNLRERVGAAAREVALRNYAPAHQAETWSRIIAAIENDRPVPSKRLLIVNVFYPPQAIGGATRVVHDNVRDLRPILGSSWSIDVVCTLEGGSQPYAITNYVQDGIRVFAITAADRPDIDSVAEDHQMGKAFAQCVDTIAPDLIHFHCVQRLTVSCLDVAADRGIPFLVTMHDGYWVSPNLFVVGPNDDEEDWYDFTGGPAVASLPQRARRMHRSLASAARILTVSESFASYIRKTGCADPLVTANGVSLVAIPAKKHELDGRVRLTHLGGAERHKGLHLVRQVLCAVPFQNLRLLLADHSMDPGDERFETWGTTPVTIFGKTPQYAVGEIYARTDVLLAPSIWPESFGLVAREALAAGCWVVVSNRGALAEDVRLGEDGFIIDVASPLALKNAFQSIDADPRRYQRPPTHRRQMRSSKQQAEQLATLYESLLSKHTSAVEP